MSVRALREKINIFIYNSKSRNLRRLKWISIGVSFIAIGCLFYYHGFEHNEKTKKLLIGIVEASFAFYVLHFLAKLFYQFSPVRYLRQNWGHALIMAMLIMEGISYNFFDTLFLQSLFRSMGVGGISSLSVLLLQGYLLIVVGMELMDSTSLFSNVKIHPSNIFIFSFVFIISVGTLLLMMPMMTHDPGGMPFLDALFTSTSATCVTGLSVVDPAAYFTYKGHVVILLLMKLGGLNIVAFAYLAAILGRFGFSVKQDSIIEDFLTRDTLYSAKGILSKVFFVSIGIEAVGAIFIYLLLTPSMGFESEKDKIFFAVFHSVSAFNNAGFSTVTDGMYSPLLRHAYLMHIVLGILIFFGAFGFTFLFDYFQPKNLRDRLRHPWKTPNFGSRLAVNTTVILLVFGAVVYTVLEYNNTLKEQNVVEALISGFFHSVSTRSAGLSTSNMALLGPATVCLMIFLMFVGGNTFSTAGGIKTSTFAILILNCYSIFRGKKDVEIFNRRIPDDDLLKAVTVLVTFMGCILLFIFLLAITETHILEQPGRSVMDLIFEEVSAFATCGLSTGITSMLSTEGRVIIIISMFIGRLGTLSIAFGIIRKISSTAYSYPREHIMVG